MQHDKERPVPDQKGSHMLAAGLLLWTIAIVVRWPLALSFADEVGYVGQAKVFLEGKVRPTTESPGVWVSRPEGLRAQYPLLVPLLITPLVAVHPRLVFLSGVAAALALASIAGRALARRGRSPAWGLVMLLHPTVTLVARTAMSDLLLTTFCVGAWWALRRDRRAATLVLLAFTVAAKPIGFLLGLAVVVGEALHLWREIRDGDRAARARVGWAVVCLAAGFALTIALNLLASGKLWFEYDHRFLGTPPFWFTYFPKTARVLAPSLVLLPPLLIAGLIPFWRRRDFGPLLVITGLGSMMCFYFFVDTGRNALETLVLSPRLILPVVAFLLIGYADLLAAAVDAHPRLRRAAATALVVTPALLALAISVRHRRWQEPEAAALAAASRVVAGRGENELGMTANASKIGMLFRGRTAWFLTANPGPTIPAVVLCSARSWSYRAAEGDMPCRLTGYASLPDSEHDGFQILVRERNSR